MIFGRTIKGRTIKGRTLSSTIIAMMRIVYFFLVTLSEIIERNGGLVMMASIGKRG